MDTRSVYKHEEFIVRFMMRQEVILTALSNFLLLQPPFFKFIYKFELQRGKEPLHPNHLPKPLELFKNLSEMLISYNEFAFFLKPNQVVDQQVGSEKFTK